MIQVPLIKGVFSPKTKENSSTLEKLVGKIKAAIAIGHYKSLGRPYAEDAYMHREMIAHYCILSQRYGCESVVSYFNQKSNTDIELLSSHITER